MMGSPAQGGAPTPDYDDWSYYCGADKLLVPKRGGIMKMKYDKLCWFWGTDPDAEIKNIDLIRMTLSSFPRISTVRLDRNPR